MTIQQEVEKQNAELTARLLGQRVTHAVRLGNTITFRLINGDQLLMKHHHECCESVWIEDVCGDPDDLVGVITQAEVAMGFMTRDEFKAVEHKSGDQDICGTWTFYKFATNRGSVTIRWCGTSNGCYSETCDLDFIPAEEEEHNGGQRERPLVASPEYRLGVASGH